MRLSGRIMLLVLVLMAAVSGPALAAWTASGTGSARAAAAVMPTGGSPTAAASGSTVTVSWPAKTLSSGAAVGGYVVKRYSAANGSPATVGAGCSGTITTTSCVEQSVPSGSWVYTDTPVQASWSGGESPTSGTVTVP